MSELSTEDIKTALIEVKNIINQYGWCQGFWGNESSGFCLVGAISKVYHNSKNINLFSLVDLLKNELFESENSGFSRDSLISWNDNPARTQADIFQILDQLIEKLS